MQNIIQQFPSVDISQILKLLIRLQKIKFAEAKSEVIKEAQFNKLLKEKIVNISEKSMRIALKK